MNSTFSQIASEVLGFIRKPDAALFDALAMNIFRYQYDVIAAYKNYCNQLLVTPDAVLAPDQIPLVSTIAFKYAELAPADAGRIPGAREFMTSGTTNGADRRGRHVVARPEVYRASAMAHLGAMLFPDGAGMRMLAMHPTAERMPESSLSAMITWCIEEFGSGESRCVADRGRVDTTAAIAFLREASAAREPVCILGTTAAFAAIFERMTESRERLKLAPGSRIMDTGGPKGQRVPLSPAEVASRADELLGVEADLVINEYGMTELCSQLYDATPFNSRYGGEPGARVKLGPPWMRAMAIDPASMRRVPDGTPGMLAFIDLANLCSVSAILTEDLGVVEDGCVRVLGRALGAGARGCALSIESFQAAARR
ncbi:MAG TPA: hypothetical protein VMV13_08670 [Candidatus Binataceae bacterium]|nr:hypothetical protein [Candidatus Binataceae bacterium]HVA68917.1 hypothetical protein [Candidatus Binataceae bacterium]